MMSSPPPPSIPVAPAEETELESLKEAPSAIPSLATVMPTVTPTVLAFEFALAEIPARLMISSEPSPPAIPMATASAVVEALLRASPLA
jgi:hypothetical protein